MSEASATFESEAMAAEPFATLAACEQLEELGHDFRRRRFERSRMARQRFARDAYRAFLDSGGQPGDMATFIAWIKDNWETIVRVFLLIVPLFI